MHAGLEAAAHNLALIAGCDMPFLNARLLRAFGRWAEGFDAAVLRHGEQQYVEPLHAAYRRSCLPAIETVIQSKRRRIVSFFLQIRVRYVAPEEIALFDPRLRSFRNVNTPEELEAVRQAWGQQGLDNAGKGC